MSIAGCPGGAGSLQDPCPGRHTRRTALAWALLSVVAAGCERARQAADRREDGDQAVRGVITAVEARSLTTADGITLRDRSGQTWRFRVGPEVDWSPGHLREHMTYGEPVTVHYRSTAEGLVAHQIAD